VTSDPLTPAAVLNAFQERAPKRIRSIDYSSRMEIAEHLDRPQHEVDPIIDEAIESELLVEHDSYPGNYELTDAGEAELDSQLFQ
jgi:hypothetical protein